MLIMCVLLRRTTLEETYVTSRARTGKNGATNASACECETASASARWKIARPEDARLSDAVIAPRGDDAYRSTR